MIMMPLILLLQALPTPLGNGYSGQVWGWFSRSTTLGGQEDKVTMAKARRPGERLRYRFVLTKSISGSSAARFEATSGACPAVAQVVASLSKLQPHAFTPPPLTDGPIPVYLDAVSYSVSGPFGEAQGQGYWTSLNGPVARWVDASLLALKACWRPLDS